MVLPILNADDPDIRRANARRSRDQERVKKLHDGRLRNIGADIVGVKNQIAEKNQRIQQEAQEEEIYVQEQQEIRRYISRVEADEALQRREEAARLQQEWLGQSLGRSGRREADIARPIKEIPAIKVDDCSVSSGQKFDGEDVLRHQRHRLQAAQCREWTSKAMTEREAKEQAVKAEEIAYNNTLQEINQMQQNAETEYEREKVRLAMETRRFNESMVASQRLQQVKSNEQTQRMNEAEIMATVQSDLISENIGQSNTSNPGRVRIDHWKGMPNDEAKRIVLLNSELLQEKEQRRRTEKEKEMEEARCQTELLRQMTLHEHESEKRRAQTNVEVQRTLQRQAQEAKEREKTQKNNSQGKIEKSFFNSFGQSFR